MADRVQHYDYLEARLEAQRTSTLIQVLAVVLVVLCLGAASLLQNPINRQRRELDLVLQSDVYEGLPPKYAWVSAAGGAFRGLAANVLWVRANRLKEEGKYYEAHQLARWICTIQPRFPAVWRFQAWNMSYNISVATHTPQERWQWVYNGIRLLRDEGIPNNDRVLGLYHELAWIWFHKVGGRSDDMHHYYKRQWAANMQTLLGAPPVGAGAAEEIDWFRPVAEAPRRLDELIDQRPGVAEIVAELKQLGVDVNESADGEVYHPLEEAYFRYYASWQTRQEVAELRASPFVTSEKLQPMFDFFEATERGAKAEDFQALMAYLRAKVLREQYKMDARFMLDATGMLGTEDPLPIDWRTPWSQSIYWTLYGREHTGELEVIREFDRLNTDRIMLFSLQSLAQRGRMIFFLHVAEPMLSYVAYLPDLRYIEAMHRKYIEMGERHKEEDEDVEERTAEILRSGHVNYLEEAIVNLYFVGRESEAQRYLEYLAMNYRNRHTGEPEERYMQGLDLFVRSQLSDLASRETALPLIQSMLANAYLNLSAGLTEQYRQGVIQAGEVYRAYQKEHADTPEGRMALTSFSQLQAEGLGFFLTNPQMPIVHHARVWAETPDDIKRITYRFENVPEYLEAMCERMDLDVNKVFPPPPGMEEAPALKREEDIARELQERMRETPP